VTDRNPPQTSAGCRASEGIRELGLDPDDPDWAAVGFDMVQPLDRAAHARLCAKRHTAIGAGSQRS
jgi:hypothetical protein